MATSAHALQAEFRRANLTGIRTITARGAVSIEMSLARLADYQFAYSQERCSWAVSKKKLVLKLNGFVVEQHTKGDVFAIVLRRSSAVRKSSQVREIFFQRSLRAIEDLQLLDEQKLVEAVKAPTDYSVLVSALSTQEVLANIRAHDSLAGARLRGIEAKRNLMEAEGGTLSSAETARLLKMSRQAVDKRRKEEKFLALQLGKKGYYYPAWQFGLNGLEQVLIALRGKDSWEQLSFFLNPSALLNDRPPLEVLRKGKSDVSAVIAAASAYGEQGG